MIRDRADRGFDRFRRTGDPRALAQVFDRTAPELWRVAAHLCRATHDAEDAMQSTFLAAIESRDDWDPARPVLPWLLGLLANRVREQRRRDARAPDAARLPQVAADDPADLAARDEFTEALRASLRRLDEPFRATLELHLLHGRAPHEIAAQLGVPAGTVRMRLFRGLEQLRQKLPRGVVVGAAVASRMPSQSFAIVRRTVLAHVPGGEAVAASGSGALAFHGLGLVALHKMQVALVLAAATVVTAWLAWPSPSVGPRTGAPNVAPVAHPIATTLDLARDEAPLAVPAPAAAAREEAPALGAGTGRLRVFVRTAWSQVPIADADVEVAMGMATLADPAAGGAATTKAPKGRGMIAASLVRARTGNDGVANVDLPPGRVKLRLREFDLREPVFATVVAGDQSECMLDVPAAVTAAVTVVDQDQRPMAGARIVGRVPRDRGLVERDLGITDAEGRWTGAFADARVTLRAVVSGRGPSRAVNLSPQAPGASLVLGGEAAVLTGTVLGADGAPCCGAALLILPGDAHWQGTEPITTRSDASGRYACDHVPTGPCHVLAARPTGTGQHRITVAEAVASAGARTQVDLRFPVGARLVAKLAQTGNVTVVPLHPNLPRALRVHGMAGADTDARDECVLDGLMPGPYEVRIGAPGAPRQTLELRDGETRELVVPVARLAWIELEVVDDDERPLSGWLAYVDRRSPQGSAAEATIGRDGRVRFEQLAQVDHEIALARATGGIPVLVQSVPCNQRTRLVVPGTALVSCRLRGSVVVAGGDTRDGLRVVMQRATGTSWRSRQDAEVPVDPATGSFACDALPPGGYHVGVLSAKHRLLALRPNVTVDGAEVDLGRIELGTATIELVVTRSDGQAVRDPFVAIGIADQPFLPWPSDATRAPGSLELVAGTHRVLVWGADIAPTFAEVTARIGERVAVPIVAIPGTPTTVKFTGMAGSSFLGVATFRRAGALLCTVVVTDPTGTFCRGLAPGSYRVEFDDGNGLRGATDFTVSTTPGAPIEVAVRR